MVIQLLELIENSSFGFGPGFSRFLVPVKRGVTLAHHLFRFRFCLFLRTGRIGARNPILRPNHRRQPNLPDTLRHQPLRLFQFLPHKRKSRRPDPLAPHPHFFLNKFDQLHKLRNCI